MRSSILGLSLHYSKIFDLDEIRTHFYRVKRKSTGTSNSLICSNKEKSLLIWWSLVQTKMISTDKQFHWE